MSGANGGASVSSAHGGAGASAEGAVTAAEADKQTLAGAVEFVKGNPTDQDVAAIITVLAAASASAAGTATSTRPKDGWGPARERMRPQYFNGPNTYTSLTPLFWTSGQ